MGDQLFCPKCKNAENLSVRLKPCPKVPSTKIQRLMQQRQSGDRISGKHQLHCVNRYLQHTNVLILKCGKCQWCSQTQGQSREHHLMQKSRLKGTDVTATDSDRDLPEEAAQAEISTCKSLRKLKKKERKKAAKAKREGTSKDTESGTQTGDMAHSNLASVSKAATVVTCKSSSPASSQQNLHQPASAGCAMFTSPRASRSKGLSVAASAQIKRKDFESQMVSPSQRGGKGEIQRRLKEVLRQDKKKTTARKSKESLAQFLQSLQ